MTINRTLRQACVSATVFGGMLLAVASFDPRVRDAVGGLIHGGHGISSWDNRAMALWQALGDALRSQSLDNAPFLTFAAVAVVLFVFMFRT